MFGHLLRPGAAIQTHQWHIQRADHRRGGGDIGADEQRAGGFHGDLNKNRRIGAGGAASDLGAVDGGLDLLRVLAGFDQDRIDTAGDQATALFGQRLLQRVIGDIAEAGQFGARADAADHPAVAVVGERAGGFARQFSRRSC